MNINTPTISSEQTMVETADRVYINPLPDLFDGLKSEDEMTQPILIKHEILPSERITYTYPIPNQLQWEIHRKMIPFLKGRNMKIKPIEIVLTPYIPDITEEIINLL